AIVLLSFMFYYWWVPARYIIAVLVIFPYVLSLFFVKSSLPEMFFKALLACGILFIAACFLLILSGHELHWLGWLGSLLSSGTGFVRTAFHGESGLFPSVTEGISELTRGGIMEIAGEVSSHWLILVLALSGLAVSAWQNRKILLFLIVPFCLGLAGFFVKRFLIFLIPATSFGLAFFIYFFFRHGTHRFGWTGSFVTGALSSVLVAVLVFPSFSFRLNPIATPGEMAAAETLKTHHADGPLWTWWDYGYMLEYLTDKPAFIDGGSQVPERVFLSAVPFAAQDPDFAANWIRFFSINGPGALARVSRRLGSKGEAVLFLQEVFSRPGSLATELEKRRLPKKWKTFLFPSGVVYIFIPYSMVDISNWWYKFGTYSLDTRETKLPFFKFIDGVVKIKKETGMLELGRDRIPLKKIEMFALKPKPHLESLIRYEKNNSKFTLIFNKEAFKALLLGDGLRKSLCINLLFNPYGYKRFVPLSYLPFQAGTWMVAGSMDFTKAD
ncbi:MAG: hypothetical protein DSZ23_04980, partial [Thermodesulfatator sp.]